MVYAMGTRTKAVTMRDRILAIYSAETPGSSRSGAMMALRASLADGAQRMLFESRLHSVRSWRIDKANGTGRQ